MNADRGKTLWDPSRLQAPHAQQDKAARVRRMFDAIAPTYELVNTLASAGRDRFWRREMVRLASVRPDDVILDIACGTGDVVRSFASSPVRPARIVGMDFCLPMLRLAARRPVDRGAFCAADALRLAVADASVSIVTCAFGVRNFQDLTAGLQEMCRALRPGGRSIVLEFSVPARPVLRRIYLWYFNRVLPLLASLVSRDRTGAYRYLPRSVVSFHRRDEIISCFQAAGFSRVAAHPLTWGIVCVYVAHKDGRRTSVQAIDVQDS